jgi:phage shock protein PspC (stress-responsive transcriptional regulator)
MSDNATPGLGDDLRELRRSRDDRVIAGVLGGAARRLGIDPVLLRIVTVVLAVFGGVGVVLYALGWLLIPDEDTESSIAEQSLGRRGSSPELGTIALAIALIIAVLIAAGGMFNSGVGTLLLLLTIVGAVMLLRRQDDETPSPAPDAGAYPPYPPYPPSAEPLVDTPDATGAPTGWPATGEPVAHPAGQPAATGPGYPAAASASTGWPEGPDWEPPTGYATEVYEPPPPPEPRPRSLLGPLTISAVAVAMGVLAVNDATWASIPASAYIATALAIVGIGLLVGTWVGRSRGLIGLGLLLALALPPAVLVADDLNLTADHTTVTVTSLDQLPDGPQSHGTGQVTYDLSGLELADDEEIDLEISQSMGELFIIVPPEADVTVTASAGMGQIEAFDGMSSGVRPSRTATDLGPDGAGGGIITLDLDLAMGRIEVTR